MAIRVSHRPRLADRLGSGYTILRLGTTPPQTAALEAALREIGAPVEVVTLADAAARRILERDVLLIRPDLHVVWRGDEMPTDPARIAAIATGHAPVLADALG